MAQGRSRGEEGEGLPRLPPGRHGLPREFVVKNQRDRIASGMIGVVVERGYHDASVTQIVAAAGVSRRTFYNYYAEGEGRPGTDLRHPARQGAAAEWREL